MKSKRKALLLAACAVLLVVASVFGTLAYLTDTETVKNTFTVGQIGLSLTEKGATDPDNDGVFSKDYHLLPGHTYEKEPVVTVDADSEDCYVRVKVTVTVPAWTGDGFAAWAEKFDENYILNDITVKGFNEGEWTVNDPVIDAEATHKTVTYILNYRDEVTEPKTLESLFNDIYVPQELDNAELAKLQDMTIDVEAHAIQADGFENAAEAWDAFERQYRN